MEQLEKLLKQQTESWAGKSELAAGLPFWQMRKCVLDQRPVVMAIIRIQR